MKKRLFYPTLAGLFLALGFTVEAQQPKKVPRIGYESGVSSREREEAFRQGLRELGYIEGKNIVIEWRFAQGKPESEVAAELVDLKVDLIVTIGSPGTG